MPTHVISGNLVRSGGVVYVAAKQTWTERIADAVTLDNETDRTATLAWAATQEHLVCDPYAVEVHPGDAGPVPLSAREQIRAGGATPVLTRLGYGTRGA
jgi:hypothetical protein